MVIFGNIGYSISKDSYYECPANRAEQMRWWEQDRSQSLIYQGPFAPQKQSLKH